MDRFVAIDVETANASRSSVCAVGAVKVENGVITDRFYRLVRPYPNYYLQRFTDEIHGISRTYTDHEPTFAGIWPELSKFINGFPLVAHNMPFDRACLRAAAKTYGIEFPDNDFLCTLRKARTTFPRQICPSFSLPHLAHFFFFFFDNHHCAIADAEACAKIAIAIL